MLAAALIEKAAASVKEALGASRVLCLQLCISEVCVLVCVLVFVRVCVWACECVSLSLSLCLCLCLSVFLLGASFSFWRLLLHLSWFLSGRLFSLRFYIFPSQHFHCMILFFDLTRL